VLSPSFEGTTALNDSNIKAAAKLWVSNKLLATTRYGPIKDWDVSGVTDMSSVFSKLAAFNADISEWDVSGVTNMYSMFQGASAFNQDISAWNVSGVTNMGYMFFKASAFNQNLCAWGSKLQPSMTNVGGMFGFTSCTNKGNPDLSITPPGPFCSSSCPKGMCLGYIA
jgi:surface protein